MNSKSLCLFALGLCLLLCPAAAGAQAEAPQGEAKLKATKVEGDISLNRDITVTVENLDKFLIPEKKRQANKFVLYLNWRKIDGVNAELVPDEKGGMGKALRFRIRHTPESKEAWAALLGSPSHALAPVTVSVGYEDNDPIASDATSKTYKLQVINKNHMFWFVLGFIVVLFALCWLTCKTSIIRDSFPDIPPRQRPFSLGRFQMAFWFFLVAASFVFIWIITGGALDSLTDSTLVLIGISGATALSSTALSASKDAEALAKRQALREEIAVSKADLKKVEKQLAESESSPPPEELSKKAANLQTKIAQTTASLKKLTDRLHTRGFFNDLVSDASGVSLHRFQIFIWTLILGVIFVKSVYDSMAMPEFSTTLLALMGISGGTYIGFKLPEKQNSAPQSESEEPTENGKGG